MKSRMIALLLSMHLTGYASDQSQSQLERKSRVKTVKRYSGSLDQLIAMRPLPGYSFLCKPLNSMSIQGGIDAQGKIALERPECSSKDGYLAQLRRYRSMVPFHELMTSSRSLPSGCGVEKISRLETEEPIVYGSVLYTRYEADKASSLMQLASSDALSSAHSQQLATSALAKLVTARSEMALPRSIACCNLPMPEQVTSVPAVPHNKDENGAKDDQEQLHGSPSASSKPIPIPSPSKVPVSIASPSKVPDRDWQLFPAYWDD